MPKQREEQRRGLVWDVLAVDHLVFEDLCGLGLGRIWGLLIGQDAGRNLAGVVPAFRVACSSLPTAARAARRLLGNLAERHPERQTSVHKTEAESLNTVNLA